MLGAGIPVVCEKPLATSTADAARLAAAARDSGLVATVPFVYRFHPMAREARDRVRAGGRVFTIQGAYLQDWLLEPEDDDWRTDPAAGGPSRAFADIGSHLADLTEFVIGDRIVRLQALTRTVHPERNGHPVASEDAAALVVETASGAIGTLLVSQVAAGHDNGLVLEVATAGGSVRFEQEDPNRLWLGARGESSVLSRGAGQNGADAQRLSLVRPGTRWATPTPSRLRPRQLRRYRWQRARRPPHVRGRAARGAAHRRRDPLRRDGHVGRRLRRSDLTPRTGVRLRDVRTGRRHTHVPNA